MPQKIDVALGLTENVKSTSDGGVETPKEFIGRVRKQTCYPTLRNVIHFFSIINIILICTLALFCLFKGTGEQQSPLTFLGLILVPIGICFVIASQQASFVLIDIADVLIEKTRQQR